MMMFQKSSSGVWCLSLLAGTRRQCLLLQLCHW